MSNSIRVKWNSEMTDRERFYRQMHYLPVDRSFHMEFGYWEENFKIWKMFTENRITRNEEADPFFGFDPFVQVSGNVWLSPAFEEKVIEERVNTKIIQNKEGLLAEVLKGSSSIPHYMKSPIETPEDWEKVKAERFRIDDPARIVDIEALKQKYPDDRDFPVGVNCGSMIGKIRDLLTVEGLAYACLDYPEMVEDMVETCCQLVEHFLDQVLPHIKFDFASGWEDICCKNGPLVNIEFFREAVVPRYKRIRKKLDEAGIDIWYTDCDGDVRPLLPYFLEGGINCLFPFEVNSCAHPGELLTEYKGRLRIMGGVDKMQLIVGKEAIRTYLESLIPFVEKGGFIPFCDHRCPPDVTEENYLYYLDLKKELFGKSLKGIDSHYHHCQWFADGEDFITSEKQYREACGLDTVNVLCLPNLQDLFPQRDMTQNILAAILKLEDPSVYAQSGFYYPEHPVRTPLPEEFHFLKQVQELMAIGFDGFKMLESKPNAHKLLQFSPDKEEYDAFFAYLEENKIPLTWHVNDPEEFWEADKVSDTAKKNGWFYGDGTFASKEDIYEEVFHVLERHPKLCVTFPHCFFMSAAPERVIALLEKYENVWIDLTPGPEMYLNFTEKHDVWVKIFKKYTHRILFGTDAKNNVPLHRKKQIVDMIRCFLRTPGMYDASEYFGRAQSLCGMGLSVEETEQILSGNFRKRMGKAPKPINKKALKAYIERYMPRIPEGSTKDMIVRYYREKL